MNRRFSRISKMIGLAALLAGCGPLSFAVDASSPERSALCLNRPVCRIVKTLDAGQDAEGAALTVLHVALSDEKQPAKTDEPQYRPYLEEYWLKQNGKDGKAAYRRVFAFCNDGYGAANIGEDAVVIGPNRISLKRVGGSAWRWVTNAVYQLVPERPLSRKEAGYHTLGGGCLETETTFQPLLQQGWLIPPPIKPGSVPDCDRKAAKSRFLAIPSLADEEQSDDLAATLATQKAGLGSCALVVNVSGGDGGGFVVRDGTDPQIQAEIRLLLLAPGKLLAQVRDPGRTPTASENWSNDDRLEI